MASAIGNRRLAARASIALVVANVRYWRTVAPVVGRELKRWEREANAIEDIELRALALAKLHDEGFHAEAAAMLATTAPRAHRDTVVEAIVALELLFDYLDGLTERPTEDPLGAGERMFAAFRQAVAIGERSKAGVGQASEGEAYLDSLSRAVSAAIARLPASSAISEVAQRVAARSAQAQTRMHARGQLGAAQLEQWACREAQDPGLSWRELACGAASSVLVLHALIAAAANPSSTPEDAARIADSYLSTCVLLTLLDGLVDHEKDTTPNSSGVAGYLGLYEDPHELAGTISALARRAIEQTRALPDGPDHVMLLTGVVAYYSSAPGAENELAQPVLARVRAELRPLITPTLAVMRAWRAVRRRTTTVDAHSDGEDTPTWHPRERRELT